jgi:hypothetical protein
MTFDSNKLYNLLPAIYRIRDSEQGEPLRQLLALITQQVGILEEDLDQLYDDQFVETCKDWVLPYIGDLIGYRLLHRIAPDEVAPRAEVANTIGYRRRKGTACMLEQLARDVTSWNARAVEFFQLLATTQYMNHVRLTNFYAPDLRQWEPLERLGTAFETTAHSVDVRHIERGKGKYNIPNIGIFLWRLTAYQLRNSPAAAVGTDGQRFLFSPLGANMPLFTGPQTENSITHLAEPINVPEPLRRRTLYEELELRRQALVDGKEITPYYFGVAPMFEIMLEGQPGPVPFDNIEVCNLSQWRIPADKKKYRRWKTDGTFVDVDRSIDLALDPELGRIAFAHPVTAGKEVLTTFHYGFSADMGGGEYERKQTFDAVLAPVDTVASPGHIQPALDTRVSGGVVELSDSGRFEETPKITVNLDQRIEFRGANECRPTLIVGGSIDVTGGTNAEVTLNGFLIAGGPIRIQNGGELHKVRLVHCTLVPGLSLGIDGTPRNAGAPSLLIEQNSPIEVEIDHCILGPIQASPNATVLIHHSIVDANRDDAVAYAGSVRRRRRGRGSQNRLIHDSPGGILSVVNSTIIGTINTGLLKLASNSILLARTKDGSPPVYSERRQTGCVRFSWLPLESRVPRRYRCQPELEISDQIEAVKKKSANMTISDADRQAIQDSVVVKLVPAFTSLMYADPGYCQLRISAPEQIRAGADDEAEMGAFHDLFQPQRESNVRTRLEEYLRFGLEAGVFYQT